MFVNFRVCSVSFADNLVQMLRQKQRSLNNASRCYFISSSTKIVMKRLAIADVRKWAKFEQDSLVISLKNIKPFSKLLLSNRKHSPFRLSSSKDKICIYRASVCENALQA